MKKLTLAQQRALLRSLPSSRIGEWKNHCRDCQMRGAGIKDMLSSAGKFLGPVVRELSPIILKEILIPLAKKKAGLGLSLPGSGLKLAGQGKKKKKK